jgi:hypothetical protein
LSEVSITRSASCSDAPTVAATRSILA